MPKISDFRKTKTISLPSYPNSKIEIYSGILFGEAIGMNITDQNKYVIEALPKFIKSWNFTGDDDKPLPITSASINIFSVDDIAFLINQIVDFIQEEKKTVKSPE